MTASNKRKLLFEYIPMDSPSLVSLREALGREKIRGLKRSKVRTIFIISSGAVYREPYLRLVGAYEHYGFSVECIHMEGLDHGSLKAVENAAFLIDRSLQRGSSQIISFGGSFAGAVMACYFVSTGDSARGAIKKVQQVSTNLITTEAEASFVYTFQKFFRPGDNVRYYGRALQMEDERPADTREAARHAPAEKILELYVPPKTKTKTPARKAAAAAAVLKEIKPMEAAPVEITPAKTAPVQIAPAKTAPVEIAPAKTAPVEIAPAKIAAVETAPVKSAPVKKAPAVTAPAAIAIMESPAAKTASKVTGPAASDDDLFEIDIETGAAEAALLAPDDTAVDEKEKKDVSAAKPPVGIKPLENAQSGKFYQSIRFKLISIISFLIVVSITLMITLATYFFKEDNKIRVDENNLKISEVTALKVKSDFQAIIDKSKLLANAIMQNTDRQEIDRYSELMLHNDRDFLFFGLAVQSKGKSSLDFIKSLYNDPLMLESQLSKKDIETAHGVNSGAFIKSFKGDTIIHNISPGLKQPVIGISLPFHKSARGGVQSVLVSFIKLDRFLKAFTASGITKTFMVNEQGDIIAHPDTTIVASGGNYIKLPIVKMMIKNPLENGNGQMRYKDEGGKYSLGSFQKIGLGGCGVIATVEEDIAFQAIYDMQWRNFYLVMIVLTTVILFIYFFAKTLTTPIIRLVSATKLIKEGNFSVTIVPTTRDEIGELTGAFIEMGKGLEEREKIKDAFGKFVNKEIAEQVLKGEIRLGGERKTAAVFFSDIRQFTAISEKLEPEQVVEFLNDYMTRMVKCINVTNGVVDKYIGDAIMAEWGVPISSGNDTENAVNASLMMRKELMELNKGRGGDKKPVIRIGCGINTGPVLAGQIGSEDRMEYTVIGDTVNLASRIESLNKPFGTDILISEDSYNLVKTVFAVEKMKPIKVKGKEKPQQIYAVLGRLDDPERPKDVDELRRLVDIDIKSLKDEAEEGGEEDMEEVKYEIIE